MKRLVSVALTAAAGLTLGVLASPSVGADPLEPPTATWSVSEGKATATGTYAGDKIGGPVEGTLTAPEGDCWEWTTVTYKDGEPGEPWHSKSTCDSGGKVELKTTVSKDPKNGTMLLMCGSMCKQVCPQDGGECKTEERFTP